MNSRSSHIIAAIAAVTVILIAVNAWHSVYRDHQASVAEHEVIARDLVSVVADQATRSVRDTGRAIAQIEEIVQAGGGVGVFRSRKDWESLRRIADGIPGGVGVVVTDANASVVARSASPTPAPVKLAETEFGAAVAAGKSLHVGGIARLDGRVVFTVSRGLFDRKGELIGLASVIVATEYLTDFYELFGFTKDPGIVIFRENGDIIARRPNVEEFIGKNIGHRPLFQVRLKQSSEGVFRGRSAMDGIDRINAYKRIQAGGLVVLVGIPWDAATAEWRRRAWRTGGIAAFSIAAIILAAIWGAAALRRAIHAERTLAGEQAVRYRMRTFIDMATHEFKTPLAVIDSSAQMLGLLVDREKPGIDRRLAMIRESVGRVIDLIDTCLAGARIDQDHPLKLMPFDPSALIRGVVARQCGHGAHIEADLGTLPAECVADSELLGVALDALIDNARRYGPAGAPIEVAARRAGASVVVSVSDRGPGIAEDEIPRIFDKHYRGSRTRSLPGSGIGLNLVKVIADLHQGSIAYQPREGGGARFVLAVPIGCLDGSSFGQERESAAFDLVEALNDVADSAGRKGIGVDLERDPAIRQPLTGDRRLLHSVLGDLIGLAASDAPACRVAVAATLVCLPDRKAVVRFTVHRRRPAPAPLIGGLVMAGRAVAGVGRRLGGAEGGPDPRLHRLMDAGISVGAGPGQGSAFSFCGVFPLSAPHADAAGSGIAGLRVLLVEDEMLNRELVRDLLVWQGAAVVTATDGAEAVRACQGSDVFDLVLMDVNIPGMDGFEATRRIRAELGDRLPVVGLSANTQPSARADALASGMTAYLTKPLDCNRLAAVISACVPGSGGPAAVPHSDGLLNAARIDAMRGTYPQDQLEGFVALFEGQVAADLAVIAEALNAGDRASAGRTAHRLAGAAANFGCRALADAARRLAHPAAEESCEVMAESLAAARTLALPTIAAVRSALTGAPARPLRQ